MPSFSTCKTLLVLIVLFAASLNFAELASARQLSEDSKNAMMNDTKMNEGLYPYNGGGYSGNYPGDPETYGTIPASDVPVVPVTHP
ncbi:hypothetical protein J5N97_005357 [Dioscorea zingiberensis]|uniref:Uncharacterized protein n=1 Tax=Dioscorea zingiberensis TaxID=325984 RepID=A0A9D5HSM6_9LILI|nr:hypothetical protein J5N97_005357 [Dioscorea zingiberensis]